MAGLLELRSKTLQHKASSYHPKVSCQTVFGIIQLKGQCLCACTFVLGIICFCFTGRSKSTRLGKGKVLANFDELSNLLPIKP